MPSLEGGRGITNTRAVLTSGAKVLGNEPLPTLVNRFWREKFVKCYVRAPERDANLKRNLPPNDALSSS